MSNWRRGRITIEARAHAINRPLLYVTADDTYVGIGLAYGNGSNDPVVLVDVNLTATRPGQLLNATYWRLRRRRDDSSE